MFRTQGKDSGMTIEDFGRAEKLTALRAQCRSRVRRQNMQNIGLCAIAIVAASLLGWTVIIWPLVGYLR